MSSTFTQQPNSSVMSIGAIISPCSNNNSQKSRQSSIDSSAHSKKPVAEYQLPSLSQQVGYTSSNCSPNHAAVGHWIKSSHQETGNIDMIHGYNHTKRMRYTSEGITVASSPSFSSSSDHESDSNSICSQPSPMVSYPTTTWSVYNDSSNRIHHHHHNKNIYTTKEVLASENLLNNNFDMEEYEENNGLCYRRRTLSFDYCDTGSHQEGNCIYSLLSSSDNKSTSSNNNKNNGSSSSSSSSSSRKGDALATRRARNKLASAKYRAKKQALTHAMQDRIMQLATQVMTFRNELSQTRKNETEILGRYERLVKYYQHNDNAMKGNVASSTSTMTTTTTTNSLF